MRNNLSPDADRLAGRTDGSTRVSQVDRSCPRDGKQKVRGCTEWEAHRASRKRLGGCSRKLARNRLWRPGSEDRGELTWWARKGGRSRPRIKVGKSNPFEMT